MEETVGGVAKVAGIGEELFGVAQVFDVDQRAPSPVSRTKELTFNWPAHLAVWMSRFEAST
jgi:hypothetical protein